MLLGSVYIFTKCVKVTLCSANEHKNIENYHFPTTVACFCFYVVLFKMVMLKRLSNNYTKSKI